jgi:dTDP-4-amino-4,6-dideoxygalactose transaminase
LIRNHGENAIEEYGLEDVSNVMGGNYRLTEISAAIGIEQLKRLDKILDHRQQLADYLNKRLNEIDGLTIQKVPDGSTHAYYVYPIKYDESVIGLPRNLFVKAVQAELPKPTGWETTPLSEGYVKPLYLNPIYQKNIAIGKRGFPFNYNRVEYEYPKGLCPVTERMYEKELLISSIVREPLNRNDMKDFVDAIEKVIENASLIRDAFRHEQITDMYNSTRAVNETDLR